MRGRGGIPSAHPPVHATHTPFHSHSGGVAGTLKGPRLPRLPWGTWPGTHTRRSQPESLLLLSRSRRRMPHHTEAAASRSLIVPRGAQQETRLSDAGKALENRNRCGGAFLDGQAGARAAGDADLLSSTLQKERRMRGGLRAKFGEEGPPRRAGRACGETPLIG